ncbi:lachesin-like [Panulirus ornatus]|uniref:lachesin-like n=1 Tax=Panulirus ornatus TaxID=150431 RepID=UPI003A86AABA
MMIMMAGREKWLAVVSLVLSLSQHNTAHGKVQHLPGNPMPSFGDPIGNITVIKGRDIIFTCVVKHLGPYKVGWVKADTKAIQAIHHQVVTHNPRVSVTYRDRTTWNLHIRNVQEDDRGVYMCQVNTDPMIAEMAHLDVVVPPEIVDNETSGETTVEEGNSVTLTCKARGYPPPVVSWKREGNVKIVLRDQGGKKVTTMEEEQLHLTRVKRSDMGPYLCIAKNGIPPSVSKRIMLKVNFAPVLEVPVHMIGSPLGKEVTVRCRVESSPTAVTTWRREPDEQMLISSHKYNVSERQDGFYVTQMSLTIRNFTMEDATTYRCVASNSLGASASSVQVYEILPQKPRVSKEEDESRLDNHIPNSLPDAADKDDLALYNDVLDPLKNTYVDPFPPGGVLEPAGEREPILDHTADAKKKKKKKTGGLTFPFFNCGQRVGVVGGRWWAWPLLVFVWTALAARHAL